MLGGLKIKVAMVTARVLKKRLTQAAEAHKEKTRWVEKRKILKLELRQVKNEPRGTNTRKKPYTREDALATAEDLKERVEEALKMRAEVKDTFKEWLNICDEAEVIMEATKIQEEELKNGLRNDGGAWDELGRKVRG